MEVTGRRLVAVDSKDRIYVSSTAAEHPMVVLDRDGSFITSWGEACSTAPMACTSMPTTISIAPTTATHTVAQVLDQRQVQLTIGIPNTSRRRS